jgi:hypothetical protein
LQERNGRKYRRCLREVTSSPPPNGANEDHANSETRVPSREGVLPSQLKRVFGLDLTKILGIRVGIAQPLFGEIGSDFSKLWMGLCPDNEISGGKVLLDD